MRLLIGIFFWDLCQGFLDPAEAPWLLFIRYSDPYQYPISTFDKTECSKAKGNCKEITKIGKFDKIEKSQKFQKIKYSQYLDKVT